MRTCLQVTIFLLLTRTAVAAGRANDKFSENAAATANTLRERILAEIKQLGDHDWAGEYYEGDGLGVNISLAVAPKAGYVFEWHGCVGVYDRNYGSLAWANDRIRLSFTFDGKTQGVQEMAPEFTPVRWGKRRYLIPANDLVGFCNKINAGEEPRADVHGSYLLRRGDEGAEISGFPNVPKEYRPYLLDRPISARILSVGKYVTRPSSGEWKFKDTPVALSFGSAKGLRVGMELYVTEPRNVVESVWVTRVEVDRSEAIMTQIEEKQPGPERGWQLSTQAPWYRVRRGTAR